MSRYVIAGAGPIGSAVAGQLLARGDEVTVVTRSGSDITGAHNVRHDANDVDGLKDLTGGAAALFNCANPAYHKWATDWPPLAASLLAAAGQSGAVLVTAANLYGYGHVVGPMSPSTPLHPNSVNGQVRAQMWQDALAAHQAGEVRVVEVRGSDYIGPHSESHFERQLPNVLTGKTAKVVGDPDAPHSWTYTEDMAATLVAVATEPAAWGRPWHAPCTAVKSQREALTAACAVAGVAAPKVVGIPTWQMTMAGWFNPQIRAVATVAYQFQGPFLSDDSETRHVLGVLPTPWSEVLAASVAASAESLQTAAG